MAGEASVVDWRARRLTGVLLRDPRFALAALVALNAAVYLLLFVGPSSLLALYQRPLLDMRRLSVGDPLARWRLLAYT